MLSLKVWLVVMPAVAGNLVCLQQCECLMVWVAVAATTDTYSLHTQSPCAGVFYFFNHPKKPTNQPSIPCTIARIWRAFLLPTAAAADRCYDQAVASALS